MNDSKPQRKAWDLKNDDAYMLLGKMCKDLALNSFDDNEMLQICEKVIELEGKEIEDPQFFEIYGMALNWVGQTERAKTALRKAITLHQKHNTLKNDSFSAKLGLHSAHRELGYIASREKNADEVEIHFKKALEYEYNPDDEDHQEMKRILSRLEYIDEVYDKKEKSSNCFIVTATYGDVNSPEVIFLREFRDNKLNRSFVEGVL